MVVCPNCGSWKMVKSEDSFYPTTSHVEELWFCDCGCMVKRLMKTVNEKIIYPNGKIVNQTVK